MIMETKIGSRRSRQGDEGRIKITKSHNRVMKTETGSTRTNPKIKIVETKTEPQRLTRFSAVVPGRLSIDPPSLT